MKNTNRISPTLTITITNDEGIRISETFGDITFEEMLADDAQRWLGLA